ncbi:hypothetical protein BJV82DRAFT_277603 [Fennellomyces sp. T-0311]|nr:hypothetical protein BJV82DRAFT_277603 [Fennellomyces sp. T-0311]
MFYVCCESQKLCMTLNMILLHADDHDIVNIFRHIKDLQHLDLSSNRITLTTLLQLAYPNLQSLALSFNPLGCHVLPFLPMLLSKCPRLESLDMESCNVTYTPVTDTIHEQYQRNENRLDHINFAFNELGDKGLLEWKPLLESVLHISNNLKV